MPRALFFFLLCLTFWKAFVSFLLPSYCVISDLLLIFYYSLVPSSIIQADIAAVISIFFFALFGFARHFISGLMGSIYTVSLP